MLSMIKVSHAIDLVAEIIAAYNPYREPEPTSAYNDKIRNQALAFIESVIDQVAPDLKPFDGDFAHGFLEIEHNFGEITYASVTESTINSELIYQLAQKRYAPITPVTNTKKKQKAHPEAKSSTLINGSEAGKGMANIRWSVHDEMKAVIEKYVAEEISKPGCTCLHAQMFDIVNFATDADNMLIYDSQVISRESLIATIKGVYKKIDETRICKHRPPIKNDCPVHKQ